ncbi:hypothetical protein [Shinella sp.]|uniref:hypothetical protein n=1 Tax=Shinella sp. TaxID=1870904 RepID=UPI00301BF341
MANSLSIRQGVSREHHRESGGGTIFSTGHNVATLNVALCDGGVPAAFVRFEADTTGPLAGGHTLALIAGKTPIRILCSLEAARIIARQMLDCSAGTCPPPPYDPKPVWRP